MSESKARRIYVRAPDSLGDVVMAIPAIRRLAERHPNAEVDVWCHFRWVPVLEMAELPVAVIPFRRRRAIWKTAAWIRAPGYSAAYLFDPGFVASAVARLAGIRKYRKVAMGTRRRVLLGGGNGAPPHRVSAYMELADPGWPGGPPPVPRLTVPARAREQFRQLMHDRIEGPVVGICPGASVTARRWPEGRFTALAGILAGEAGTVLVFGGPGDEVLAARIAAGAADRGVDLGGRTSLAVFAAGLSACDVVVASDSGAMHLAAAVGAPVVGIFGARSPKQTGPLSERARALWSSRLECAPCGRDTCRREGSGTYLPEAHDECLHLITVEAVSQAAREQLEGARTSSDV